MLLRHYCRLRGAGAVRAALPPEKGDPTVHDVLLLRCFWALSWIISRMSLDTFRRSARPRSHAQKCTLEHLQVFSCWTSGHTAHTHAEGIPVAAVQPSPYLGYFGLKSLPGIFGCCVLSRSLRSGGKKSLQKDWQVFFCQRLSALLVQSWLPFCPRENCSAPGRKEGNAFIAAQSCPASAQHQPG